MASVDLTFFGDIQQSLEQEYNRKDEIRVKVRELERTCRKLVATLDLIHSNPTGPVPDITFTEVQQQVKELAALIPDNQFYKYCDLWSRQIQQAIFLVVFKHYLENEELVQIPAIEEAIGCKLKSRLAINAVTAGDYKRPLRLSTFLGRLSAGFQLLNLKNDSLRKRFDSIKYDVKKIEEVVYDISLRGLQKDEDDNEHNKKKAKLSHNE
ncbi:Translin [Lichtheimia hyalospora FSU 10163]|nr:Translin [Lichtheimia hyalospora FSU 10163]